MLRCLDNDLMVTESVHRPIERRGLMTYRGSLAVQGRKLVSHDPNTPLSIPFKSPHFRWCLAFVTSAENTRTAGLVCCGRKGCKLMWALRSLGCDNHPFTCCWVLPDLGHNLVYRATCPDDQPFCRLDLKLSFRFSYGSWRTLTPGPYFGSGCIGSRHIVSEWEFAGPRPRIGDQDTIEART